MKNPRANARGFTDSVRDEQLGIPTPRASRRRYPTSPEGLAGRGNADNRGQIALPSGLRKSLRKEVIQPQVPLRLPCYDLVPVTSLAVGTDESRRLKALPASMT